MGQCAELIIGPRHLSPANARDLEIEHVQDSKSWANSYLSNG
jgi:hypothetical protein